LPKACDFTVLNNTMAELKDGERGLYCTRNTFTYSLVGQSSQELSQVFAKAFTIAGAKDEAVTYLFDLTLGFDFATSAQLKAVLRRIDAGAEREEYVYDPLACLYDHSCIESELVGKNELNIDVILTSGDYELLIYDQQETHIRNWMTNQAGLVSVPFTFELQAVPIVQNEERVMCGDKLYLTETFIQSRFIDGRGGQKFTFEDNVIFSLVNATQKIRFTPEEDMLLKMSSKEAYGVNMAMTLCAEHDCFFSSSQVGNTEVLFTTLHKGESYYVQLDFSNSIIALSSFFDCPHAHLQISMMKLSDANQLLAGQADKQSNWIASQGRTSDSALASIFNSLSESKTQVEVPNSLVDPKTVFMYGAGKEKPSPQAQSRVVTKRDFTIQEGAQRQVLFEIFYDPQFYDLELLIESKDASEVRSHLYSGHSSIEVSKYKGAKRVQVEIEPGDYTFKVVAKIPGATRETRKMQIMYYEFQLFVVQGANLPGRALRPTSLNYLGLLGVGGKDFGQLVHLVHDVALNAREHLDLEFVLSGESDQHGPGPTVDVQAIEIDGEGEQLDISLVELPKDGSQKEGEPERTVKAKSSHYHDSWEEGVAYESLLATDIHQNTRYRMRLMNKDASKRARSSLKLVVTERFESSRYTSEAEIVPRSFEEVMRVKPKVPGLKESSFIQGNKSVMEAFKVAALQPYVPKSQKVYQAMFKTGENTDDSFMASL